MKPLKIILVFLVLLAAGGQVTEADKLDTVLQYAPVIYDQGGESNATAPENVFTLVNYDLDWRSNNNRQDLPFYPPERAVYYSLVESDTHYYIGYYLYYPRDGDGDNPKEHCLTGILAAVGKGDGGTGSLEGIVSYGRDNWRWRDGAKVKLESGRPALAVSPQNHELRVLGINQRLPAFAGFSPLSSGQEDAAVGRHADGKWTYGGYRLVPLEELWQRRNDIGPGLTYSRWGYFDSNTYSLGAAALPWVWEYKRYNLLAQPAELVGKLQGIKNNPANYIDNTYADIVKSL